jgi:hypothetical protein
MGSGATQLLRTVIFEPNGHGHRFWYCNLLMAHQLDRNDPVEVVTSRASSALAEYRTHIAPMVERGATVTFLPGEPTSGGVAVTVRHVAYLIRTARRGGCRVVVPEADRLVLACSLLAPAFPRDSLSLLVMRPGTSWKQRFKHGCGRLLARRQRVHELGDPLGIRRGRDVVRDPVLRGSTPARPPGDRRSSRYTLLIAGVIDERKCVRPILDAARTNDSVHVVMAGRHSPGIRRLLDTVPLEERSRFTSIDRFLSDDELVEEVSRADAVSVVLNTTSGSSGMLGQAVAMRKPVLAAHNMTVSASVRASGIGVVADSTAPVDLARAIRELMSGDFRSALEDAAVSLDYGSSFHSVLAGSSP